MAKKVMCEAAIGLREPILMDACDIATIESKKPWAWETLRKAV